MSEPTELRDQLIPRAESKPQTASSAGAWARFQLGTRRAIFWAYRRGSWQYDLIVGAILAFILLTPRAWFRKAPTLGLVDLRHVQGIVEIAHSKESWTYLVDSRLVQSHAGQEPEEAVRQILEQGLQKPVRVRSVDIVRDKSGVVLAYKVIVAR